MRHVHPKTEATGPIFDDTAGPAPIPIADPSAWDEREGPTWIDNL